MASLNIHLGEDKTKSKFFPSKRKINPVGIYLLKGNNRNTRARYELCSKLTIKTPEVVWVHLNQFLVTVVIAFRNIVGI